MNTRRTFLESMAVFLSLNLGFTPRRKVADGQSPPEGEQFHLDDLLTKLRTNGERYLPFLERSTLKAGLYVLPKGAVDKQQPHTLDEVYYVVEGRSKFKVGEKEMNVTPGTVL